jgi:cytochrome P450
VGRGELAPGCPVQVDADGVWHVRDFATAREILRNTSTRQAGVQAEHATKVEGRMRVPVLYRDGPEHREHRRQTARFFTPRRVDSAYRSMMERLADEQIVKLRRQGEADLTRLSFALAVAVTGEVIGLSGTGTGTARRLEKFFIARNTANPLAGFVTRRRSDVNLALFYLRDVRPTVRARRRTRRDDLISHLIDEGCTNAEMLGECVTFAAAGMVTTREFITVAAWHLFSDDELRASYLTGDEERRVAILHEILRLEPVVYDLFRRATSDIAVPGAVIPSGATVTVGVAAANVDPAVAGPDAGQVCPGRDLGEGLSFGDGPHRCPGSYVAIQETDIFLTRLFAQPGVRMVSPPTVGARAEIASYELRGLRVAVAATQHRRRGAFSGAPD